MNPKRFLFVFLIIVFVPNVVLANPLALPENPSMVDELFGTMPFLLSIFSLAVISEFFVWYLFFGKKLKIFQIFFGVLVAHLFSVSFIGIFLVFSERYSIFQQRFSLAERIILFIILELLIIITEFVFLKVYLNLLRKRKKLLAEIDFMLMLLVILANALSFFIGIFIFSEFVDFFENFLSGMS